MMSMARNGKEADMSAKPIVGRHAAHHGPGAVIHAVLNHAHGPVVTVPSAPSASG
jgi:hypothetical protein